MSVFSLAEFAALLIEGVHHVTESNHEALEEGAKMLEEKAKSIFGTNQLVANAPTTVAIKGFNAPGFETGETQESIQHNSDHEEAYIGSNNPKMIWLEYGTTKTGGAWGSDNPPRPILGIAVAQGAQEVVDTIGRKVVAKLLPP